MRKTLTFIGNGKMALSLAQGLKESYAIEVVGRDMQKLSTFEHDLGTTVEKHLLDGFDITDKHLILCVKPANIISVGQQVSGKATLLYSVLAGTTLKALGANIGAKATVRAMPNLGATVGRSMTTLTGEERDKEDAIALFESIGTTLWVNTEKELDIATALAGSGPAYLALIAEALADGAVREGIKRADALTLVRGLFDGFGAMIQDEHPALLKDAVMSPGGTTAAGYGALEKNGVRQGCMEAIASAAKRAKELA